MLKPIRNPLNTAGVEIEEKRNSRSNQFIGIEFSLKDGIISPVDIKTGPYPEFPTDLLPQWVAFMTQVTGNEEKASIYDKIYDNRFKYVEDLKKMKAVIEKIDKTELTDGPDGYCVYGGTFTLLVVNLLSLRIRTIPIHLISFLSCNFLRLQLQQ